MNKRKVLDSLYYRFEPATRRIIFDTSIGLNVEDILLIVNMNGNRMIYNFNCVEEGGVFGNGILTLVYNTTTMNPSDSLMVVIADEDKSEFYLEKIYNELKSNNELLLEFINKQ